MAPSNLILRSASISSSSTASSKSSKSTNDGIKKKFGCSHPGCGKSFSRSEHLHRHALNHKDGNHTCLRCSAHFRRRDLLERHTARHKEKDEEAGGEGLGVLATRKRLWRDSDGNIVNSRRPSCTQDGNKRRMTGRSMEQSGSGRRDSQASLYMEDERRRSINSNSMASPPIPMSRIGSTQSTIVVDTARRYPTQQSLKAEDDEEELEQNPSWLPSPPHSAFSLTHSPSIPSSAQSPCEDADADADGELDTLYEDNTQTASWPLRLNTTHHGIPHILNASTPIQSEYPADPSWGSGNSSSHQQSFQTFMGSVGGFDDGMVSQTSQLKQDDYGMGMNMGMGMGMGICGLYGWQSPWANQNQMMLSRVREEKYEGHSNGASFMGDSLRSTGFFGGQEIHRRGFMGAC